jgi:two-component system response regulator
MYHILLIEDNPAHAKLMFRHLTKMGDYLRATHLTDGEAAYDYLLNCDFAHDPIHLILLDLRLPRIDGIELLRRIRSKPISLQVPVVVLTSSERDEDIREAYAAGANSYLVKPVAYDKVQELIEQLTSYWFQHNRMPSMP